MPSAGLPSTQGRQKPAAGPEAPCLCSVHIGADSHWADFEALAHLEAAGRASSALSSADRGHGRAVFHTAAVWLRRALADSARAWALAAGVPPDLYN